MSKQFDKIMADLRQGNYKPIYFLCGDEPFYIDRVTNYIAKNALDEGERDFNQTILYGRDTDTDEIRTAVNRYPMMAERQVVIVKEAQHIRNIDALVDLFEKPVPTTIFVINYKGKKPDRRKDFGKTVDANSEFMVSQKLRDYQVPQWIEQHVGDKGFSIDPKTASVLAEHLGNDLNKIFNELEKLRITLPEGSSITPNIVEKHIGVSKDYNVFELQSALATNDDEKLFRIVFYFAQNIKQHSLIPTLAMLYAYFMKVMRVHRAPKGGDKNAAARFVGVHPFLFKEYRLAANRFSVNRISEIIALIREYDLKTKGVNNATVSEGALMTEFFIKLQRTK